MSKKNIYIIVIVICFAGTAGILYYGFGSSNSGSSVSPAPTVTNYSPTTGTQNTNPAAVTGTVAGAAPAVFPADTKFDWSVLNSTTFKNLQSVPALTIDPSQIGQDNPFASK